ncbi:YbaB/EbfC family nucleoid-associated protein [Glycomyces luteolus]|uniref:YbaB/EbfC family nucleoid-associated protein n=1 Tax=Glycomyces luteolus TaxID=2670330 RepID=A0A9X3PES1_9ACTN|nr:YbaB/EbfC family nucleoid-associated protein [Glycomyces luteolus]MDA1362183.1 YbaB/EbfC family nucleoid-associated protein [Glycomyces luteolus]
MNSNPDASGIGDILERALSVVREGKQAQEAVDAQTVEAEAADGQVRVTATLSGSVKVAIVDPRAVRLGAEVLAEEITTAVNAALDAAREQAGLPGAMDLDGLSSKIEEIQQQSTQRMQAFMSSLAGAHSSIARAASEERNR